MIIFSWKLEVRGEKDGEKRGGNGYVDIFAGTGVEEGGLLMDAG